MREKKLSNVYVILKCIICTLNYALCILKNDTYFKPAATEYKEIHKWKNFY